MGANISGGLYDSLLACAIDGYKFELIQDVHADDLKSLVGIKRLCYFVPNYFGSLWEFCGYGQPNRDYSEEKKVMIQKALGDRVQLIAANSDFKSKKGWLLKAITDSDQTVTYLTVFGGGKITRQIFSIFRSLLWLIKNSNSVDGVVFYNGHPCFLLASICAKLLRKQVIVDVEEDYSLREGLLLSKVSQTFSCRIADKLILSNKQMRDRWGSKQSAIFNAQLDFGYLKKQTCNFQNRIKFIYTGSLDRLRGIERLPAIIAVLNEAIPGKWKIDICGFGPLSDLCMALNDNKSVIYHGYVSKERLNALISESDFGLILQPPDSHFSRGSFPSKIINYVQNEVPVLCLRNMQTGYSWNKAQP